MKHMQPVAKFLSVKGRRTTKEVQVLRGRSQGLQTTGNCATHWEKKVRIKTIYFKQKTNTRVLFYRPRLGLIMNRIFFGKVLSTGTFVLNEYFLQPAFCAIVQKHLLRCEQQQRSTQAASIT